VPVFTDPPHTYDELCDQIPCPLSRLYHQRSKLSEYGQQQLQERIAAYNQDLEAVRRSSRAYKSYPTRPQVRLPRPGRRFRGRRLDDALKSRRTRRGEFAPEPVALKQWSRLLDAACGITGRATHPEFPDVVQDLRAWPSGGALYPIEVYLLALESKELDRAVFHYQVPSHALARLGPCPDQQRLERLVLAEGLWEHARGLIVLTAVFERTQIKYDERGYRFMLLDAGHLAQNLLLVCEDLHLAAIPLGGFQDDGLAKVLGLDPAEEGPLYAILIGAARR
jgi:SagB-type dehydrogenase family enzyme